MAKPFAAFFRRAVENILDTRHYVFESGIYREFHVLPFRRH